MRAVAVVTLGLALVPLSLACADDGSDALPDDRASAIRRAEESHASAVAQGVDFRTAPCIFDAGDASDWVIVVDYGERTPFAEVAGECPSFAAGLVRHAVVVTVEGDLIAAR